MHLEDVNVPLKRYRRSFPGIKLSEFEFSHSHLSRTKFETGWRYSSTPLSVSSCHVRDIFTFVCAVANGCSCYIFTHFSSSARRNNPTNCFKITYMFYFKRCHNHKANNHTLYLLINE